MKRSLLNFVLTLAAVPVTAAVVAAECVHDVNGRGGDGELPGPEGGVQAHRVPALLLHPVQVQHRVPRVSRILRKNHH
jgi:hypothetical protein